jgi:uracil-DNA glycosylase
MLWGAHAQSKAGLTDSGRSRGRAALDFGVPITLALVGIAGRRCPFWGCGHFGQVNRWFRSAKQNPIDW